LSLKNKMFGILILRWGGVCLGTEGPLGYAPELGLGRKLRHALGGRGVKEFLTKHKNFSFFGNFVTRKKIRFFA